MYTADSVLSGYKELNKEFLAHIAASLPHSTYTYYDFLSIFSSYEEHCIVADINTELIIAQMFHETNWCRSWWSQRPRRNPAGIRVTGERKLLLSPKDIVKEWQWDSKENIYKRGLSFPSWQESSSVHIGHILCYMYTDSEMTADQLALSMKSPNKAILSALKYRGVAKTIRGLNGRWAYPGVYYADAIARIANTITALSRKRNTT